MLFPLVAAGAGFVLGRRKFLWQMAGITTVIVAAAAFQLIRIGEPVTLDLRALGFLAVVTVASIWLTAWMEGRSLQPEANEREILGEPLTVVRGVMIVPFHWAVGGIQADALRLELGDLKRVHSPRWVVLDLGPAGEVGRRDLSAVERAVEVDQRLTLYDRTGATAGRRHRAPGHRATSGRPGRTLRHRAAGGRGRPAPARVGDQHGAGAAGGDDDLTKVSFQIHDVEDTCKKPPALVAEGFLYILTSVHSSIACFSVRMRKGASVYAKSSRSRIFRASA